MVLNRRSEIEIMGNILDLSKKGAKKTEFLYKANLSYAQLRNYLLFLLEKNILEETTVRYNGSSCKVYTITDKGSDFLQDIKKVLTHLS